MRMYYCDMWYVTRSTIWKSHICLPIFVAICHLYMVPNPRALFRFNFQHSFLKAANWGFISQVYYIDSLNLGHANFFRNKCLKLYFLLLVLLLMTCCFLVPSHLLKQSWLDPQHFNEIIFKIRTFKKINWNLPSAKCQPFYSGLEVLTHLLLDKMTAISQTIFSDAFLWMKSFVFWLKFHWGLFLGVQLTIT